MNKKRKKRLLHLWYKSLWICCKLSTCCGFIVHSMSYNEFTAYRSKCSESFIDSRSQGVEAHNIRKRSARY